VSRPRKPRGKSIRIGDVVGKDGVYRVRSGDYIEPVRSVRRSRKTRRARSGRR